MAIGFPAYRKERRTLTTSAEETRLKAIDALQKMNCQEIGLHPFALDYKTVGSVLTTGERIYVNITETEIIIRSECLFPTRIFDFGKNKSNIAEFWKYFEVI